MDLDLSWSSRLKADAPTMVKDLRKEVKRHMDLITTNISKMDNVGFALKEGEFALRKVLCKGCKDAVISKRNQIHSGKEPTLQKRPLKMLPPERLQIVKEITNILIQLESSKSENKEEEFCSEEEYYEQEMIELKQLWQDELERLKSELKTEKEEKDDIKRRNEELSKKLNLFKEKEGEIATLKTENKRMRTSLESCEQDKNKLLRDVKKKDEELNRYRQPSLRSRPRTTLDSKYEETRRLQEDLRSKSGELQQAYIQIQDVKSSCNDHIHALEEVKKENISLKNDLCEKNEEIKLMANKIKDLQKQRRKESVLGLCKERSGMGKAMVDMITRELQRRVGGLLEGDNTDLTIKQCTGTSDIPNGPLIVLCLNMSRIGTNIQDALGGIQYDKNVFVMVLHHTSKENLSSLTPTSLRVTGSELRQLGGIIDMAFSSDSGLYDCDLNNNAIDKITSIMRKY